LVYHRCAFIKQIYIFLLHKVQSIISWSDNEFTVLVVFVRCILKMRFSRDTFPFTYRHTYKKYKHNWPNFIKIPKNKLYIRINNSLKRRGVTATVTGPNDIPLIDKMLFSFLLSLEMLWIAETSYHATTFVIL
jgi:hypothetical protein